MKTTIRWKDCDRSPSIEKIINEKVDSLQKFDFVNDDVKMEVVHYAKKNEFKIRINLTVKKGKSLRAESCDENCITALNLCIDKMLDQLRRVKTKMIDNKR